MTALLYRDTAILRHPYCGTATAIIIRGNNVTRVSVLVFRPPRALDLLFGVVGGLTVFDHYRRTDDTKMLIFLKYSNIPHVRVIFYWVVPVRPLFLSVALCCMERC